ncbi:cadherin EGF LAG seven-pass G-type receptor 2-like [Glandiceps talaboti]
MRRYCKEDGEWDNVDTTACVSVIMANYLQQFRDATSPTDILGLIKDVYDWHTNAPSMFGGDLLSSIDMLDVINEREHLLEAANEETKSIICNVISLTNGLLDEHYESQWKQIHQNLGPNKGSVGALTALEKFGDLAQGFVRLRGEGVHVSTKNIDYTVSLVTNYTMDHRFPKYIHGPKNKRETSECGFQTSIGDTHVIIPSEILDNTSEVSTVMTAIYHNPGDMFPSSSTEPKLKQWIYSLTAKKKVWKVNTPVISVKVYHTAKPAQLKLRKNITLVLYHQQDGYGPRCSFFEIGDPKGALSTKGCSVVNRGSTDNYTKCTCNHLTSFVVAMVIGKEPIPFLTEARKYVVMVASFLAMILMIVAFILILMSRINIDRYFVMANATLAYMLFPIGVFAGQLQEEESEQGCRQTVIFMTFVLLTTNAWLLCQSIQVFVKLRYFIYITTKRRMLYLITGWLIPALLTGFSFIINADGSYNDGCILPLYDKRTLLSLTVTVLVNMASFIFLAISHHTFVQFEREFIDLEKDHLWNDLLGTSVLYPTLTLAWVFGAISMLSENEIYGYVFAGSVFVLGSVVYLGFSAVNKEVLKGVRVLCSSDVLVTDSLKEEKFIEVQRYASRRQKRPASGRNKIADNSKNEEAHSKDVEELSLSEVQ